MLAYTQFNLELALLDFVDLALSLELQTSPLKKASYQPNTILLVFFQHFSLKVFDSYFLLTHQITDWMKDKGGC